MHERVFWEAVFPGVNSRVSTTHDIFDHQLRAEKGHHQHHEPGQRQADGGHGAPAEEMAPGQQRDEQCPGQHGQHGLVGDTLRQQIVHVDEARQHGGSQQQGTGPEQLEQHRLHDLDRREDTHDAANVATLELAVLDQQQQGLGRRDRQHGIGEDREQHMNRHAVGQRMGRIAGLGPQQGRDAQGTEGEYQCADPLDAPVQAGDRHQGGAGAGNHRRHREQTQADTVGGDDGQPQAQGMGGHRRQPQHQQQAPTIGHCATQTSHDDDRGDQIQRHGGQSGPGCNAHKCLF